MTISHHSIVRVTWGGFFPSGRTWSTQWDYLIQAPFPLAPPTAFQVAAAAQDAWLSSLCLKQSAQANPRGILAREIVALITYGDRPGYYVWGDTGFSPHPYLPGPNSPAVPNSACLTMTKVTSDLSRHGQGMVHIPGVPEDDTVPEGTFLTAIALAEWTTAVHQIVALAPPAAAWAADLVVLSPTAAARTGNPIQQSYSAVNSIVLKRGVGSCNKRKPPLF